MTWDQFWTVAAQEGFELAMTLLQKWLSKAPPTQADYEQLRALNNETAETKIIKAAASKGIPANDPRVLALLAAVPAP